MANRNGSNGVSYQTSQQLKDVHHYTKSLQIGQPDDKKRLHDGFGLENLRANILGLRDEEVEFSEKLNCLRFLQKHLANNDTKVRCLGFGLLLSLNYLIENSIGLDGDALVCKLYASMAAVPSCLFAIHRQQCVEKMLRVVNNREMKGSTDTEKLLASREAAGDAIARLCASWGSRRVLIGDEVPPGFETDSLLLQPSTVTTAREEAKTSLHPMPSRDERAILGSNLVRSLVEVIGGLNRGDQQVSWRMVSYALESLSNLTEEESGRDVCLITDALRELNDLFNVLNSRAGMWLGPATIEEEEDMEVEALQGLVMMRRLTERSATLVWNLFLSAEGKQQQVDQLKRLPAALGHSLLHVLGVPARQIRLKGAITGALCALFVDAKAKPAAIEPLFADESEATAAGFPDRKNVDLTELLIELLGEANRMLACVYGGFRSIGGAPPILPPSLVEGEGGREVVQDGVEALVKNSVQCLRLIGELPAARTTRLSTLLGGEAELCNQVFAGTPFEAVMQELTGVRPL